MSWKIEIKYLYFIMACTDCKKKTEIKKELIDSSEFVSRGVIWFVIIWSIFACYGIYSFIKNLL